MLERMPKYHAIGGGLGVAFSITTVLFGVQSARGSSREEMLLAAGDATCCTPPNPPQRLSLTIVAVLPPTIMDPQWGEANMAYRKYQKVL